MASERAIAASLKVLARAFAGTVDRARIEVYCAALEDLTDAEIATATTAVVKTHTGEWIPPPAVLRRAVAPAPAVVDAPTILRRIAALAIYSPSRGMIYPPVSVVADKLGEAAAYAYAAAGGDRVFSDNEVSRDIAEREFQKAMTEAVNRPDAALLVVGVQPARNILAAGPQEVP